MKHWILAVVVLLGGALSLASADYVLIKANVGQTTQSANNNSGEGAPGPGNTGGQMGGLPGGFPGGQKGGPGLGQLGGPPGGQRGGPGLGQMGGLPSGGTSGPGLGQMGGTEGQGAAGQPVEVLAVVEVDSPDKTLQQLSKIEYDPNKRQIPPIVTTPFHLGRQEKGVVRLLNITPGVMSPEVSFEAVAGKTVAKRYEEQYSKLYPVGKPDAKPSANQILTVAEWAVSHGMNDKVGELMKKLAELDKDSPVVAAFNQLQADLDKPVKEGGEALKAHLQDYAQATLKDAKGQDLNGHYVLFYSVNYSDKGEVQDRLLRLEDALHTYYYWLVLKGQYKAPLHVPEERMPALLATQDPEFRHQREGFSDAPVVGGGFFARRENLSVYCAHPQDPMYDLVDLASRSIWSDGYNKVEILTGRDRAGYPAGAGIESRAYVSMIALLQEALADESARAAVTHDSTRQLLFASGMLPRGVVVPEWVQFGMGSFFETPVHSPWPTPTGLSSLYLPIFRDELGDKGRKFEGSEYPTLRKVVTDGYFRELKPEDRKKTTPELLKARAVTWSLMYFLAQRHIGNLERYFQLLGEQPRDLQLDDKALWECFARAFDAYDAKTKQVSEDKLASLAVEWWDFVLGEKFENEEIVAKLHKAYEDLNKAPEETAASGPAQPKSGGPKAP
jgi:hypothetical protein